MGKVWEVMGIYCTDMMTIPNKSVINMDIR